MAYVKNTTEYVDKTKELLETLEKGILDTMNSENYKAFLKFQSQFHSYSFNNQLLIHLQRPNASMVAGYGSWDKFERHVIKGEKGISILAPNPYKYPKEIDRTDPKTGITEKVTVEMQGKRFKKVSVFDVSQTDGKELPSICKELLGNSVNAESIIKSIKKVSEVRIIEKEIESGAKGYYSRSEDLIAINKGMSLDQTAKTLIHEYAHSQLHNTEAASQLDRATKEVQAESVAYVVSNRFGVDTSEYTFDYLANWSSGKDLKELKESFNLIQKTSDKFINKIEEVLKRELELQNCPAKITIVWSEGDKFKKGQMFDFSEASKIFDKLDQDQSTLRKTNSQIDLTKVTAGDNIPHVPYFKVKFELELSNGTIREARFDIGESGYKSFAECVKKECSVDVEKYIKDHELKLTNPESDFNKTSKSGSFAQDFQEQKDDALYKEVNKDVAKSTTFETNIEVYNCKDKIIDMYRKELPAIKHITERTATIINTLNETKEHPLTIKGIKSLHTKLGKKLESSNLPEDLNDYKILREVVDDINHAKLVQKQEQAHAKALENPLSKSKNMEMVQ